MNKVARVTFLILCFSLILLGCKNSETKKIVPAKEILERMYTRYNVSDPFKFKYESLYSYENDLLQKRKTVSDQDKTSTEILFYNKQGKLEKTEMHNADMMLFEDKVYYDEKGHWKLKQTFNTRGEKIADLEVSERTDEQVTGKGYIRKSQVRMLSKNNGQDSVMLRQIVHDEQAYYQKWTYKKTATGDMVSIRGHQVELVAPESFEVRNDSLIASFDYAYQYPPDCPDWSIMIADSYYKAKSGEMINRRDSVLRITISLEEAVLTDELLEGFWQVREMPGTSYRFFANNQYKAYSGSQLAEKGTWNILESKQKIMFQTIGLKGKKSIKFWNIGEVFQDKIVINIHDKKQSVVRLNKDFTFYKYDNQ